MLFSSASNRKFVFTLPLSEASHDDGLLFDLLGNVSLLPFEIWPDGEQREWTIDSGVAITQEQEQVHPFRFGPFAQQNQKSLQAASESTR